MTAEQWFRLFGATLGLSALLLTLLVLLDTEIEIAILAAIIANIVGSIGQIALKLVGGKE